MQLVTAVYSLQHVIRAAFTRTGRRLAGRGLENFDIFSETPTQTFYEGPVFDPLKIRAGLRPLLGTPASGLHPASAPVPADLVVGRTFDLDVDPERSHFGDAIHIIDAPGEERVDPRFPPFGWSGKSIVGGFALTTSPLRGRLRIKFASEAEDDLIDISISHPGGLLGKNGILSSPAGYCLPVYSNRVSDTHLLSHGRVDLSSGRIFDFHYNVSFYNSAIVELLTVNPGLRSPPLLFPGVPHAGHAIGYFRMDRESEVASLEIDAELFLPLDEAAKGRPIRMPASRDGARYQQPLTARNSSLHPYIAVRASTAASHDDATGRSADGAATLLEQYQDSRVSLICLPPSTNYGDEFTLNNPCFGGPATAMSPLTGYLDVQFGRISNQRLPYVVELRSPNEAFAAKLRRLLKALPPGSRAGLIGMQGYLEFPKIKYLQSNLSFSSDPQKLSLGVINLATPLLEHELVLRSFLFLSVYEKLIAVEPRTPTDSFAYLTRTWFRQTLSGHLLLEAAGHVHIPYPAGYGFPLPNGKRGIYIGAGSYLTPFVNFHAIQTDALVAAAGLRGAVDIERLVRAAGNAVRRVTFSQDGVGPVHWSFEGDRSRLTGAALARMVATPNGHTYVVSEFPLDQAPSTSVQAWLDLHDGEAEVLCFSTDDSLDFWSRGMTGVVPLPAQRP